MEATLNIVKDCATCLYMTTHEQCNGCLYSADDVADLREGRTERLPDNKYLHYKEGNWLKRRIQFELDGKRSIVIGGQGEAEVNTLATPQETSEHLHYVAEECGYLCNNLRHAKDGRTFLHICTTEGAFELEWASGWPTRLAYIWALEHDDDGNETARRESWPIVHGEQLANMPD